MNETREISVTQEMIITGERQSCWTCPAAKAVDAELADGLVSSVTQSGVSIHHDSKALGIEPCVAMTQTPSRVVDFIWDFDASEPVSPFTFPLTLPAELWRVN